MKIVFFLLLSIYILKAEIPTITTWNKIIKKEILDNLSSKRLTFPHQNLYVLKKIKNLTADNINTSQLSIDIVRVLSIQINVQIQTSSNAIGEIEGLIFDFYEDYKIKHNNLYVLVLRYINTQTGIYHTYLYFQKNKYQYERGLIGW